MCNADFSQCIEVTHMHSRVSWELDREALARSSIVCKNAEMGRCMRQKMVSKFHEGFQGGPGYYWSCSPQVSGCSTRSRAYWKICLRTRNILKVTTFPPATYEFVRRVDEMKRQTPMQRYERPPGIRSPPHPASKKSQ